MSGTIAHQPLEVRRRLSQLAPPPRHLLLRRHRRVPQPRQLRARPLRRRLQRLRAACSRAHQGFLALHPPEGGVPQDAPGARDREERERRARRRGGVGRALDGGRQRSRRGLEELVLGGPKFPRRRLEVRAPDLHPIVHGFRGDGGELRRGRDGGRYRGVHRGRGGVGAAAGGAERRFEALREIHARRLRRCAFGQPGEDGLCGN